jgi:hypothetical protein
VGYWELSAQQRRSFNGRVFRYATLDTPQELYSFSANSNRPHKPDRNRPGKFDPMYFLTKSNLLEGIGNSKAPRDVFDAIRDGVALCEDWGNDLKFLFILNIPEGLSVEAWTGLAKFQNRGMGKADSLAGGWLQYVIDIDARLEHYLDGPIRTGV